MDFFSVAGRILSLFLIMAIGFGLNKAKMLNEETNSIYTKLVLNVTMPAQIVTAFLSHRGMMSYGEIFQGLAVAASLFLVYIVVTMVYLLICRVNKRQRGVYLFMGMFSNVAFMGYPVITAVLGEEAMLPAVLMSVMFNLWCFTAGVFLIGDNEREQHFNPKAFLNVPLIASLLSIILYFVGVDFPEPVMTSLGYLGNVTTPLAMLVLGSSIASMPMKTFFDDWRVYVFTVFRLLIIPIVAFFYLKMIPGVSELTKGTYLLASAMPVATSATMMAIEYKGEVELAAKGIFFSTLLSMLSIPLFAMFC